MPKTKKLPKKRSYKKGGEKTSDIETGPVDRDITPYKIPPDPLREKKYNSRVIEESFKRVPTSEVEDIFSKRPHEEQELENMRNEEMNQLIGDYDVPMDTWTMDKGGRKSRRHIRKSRRHRRKSRRHRRKKNNKSHKY